MDDDKIKSIYFSLKNKNKKEWAELMEQLTKDQKRKLIFYIRKKNKHSLHKIKNIKTEKSNEKSKTKSNRPYYDHVLIDYTNVNYDLNLKNYIARILRLYKLEDNFEFIKALHLYMNILCYIIFKKFSYEYKNQQKNKNLLLFLKKLFPFEFHNFEKKYNMRWGNDASPLSENVENKNIPNVEEINSMDEVEGNINESKEQSVNFNNIYNVQNEVFVENKNDHNNTSNIYGEQNCSYDKNDSISEKNKTKINELDHKIDCDNTDVYIKTEKDNDDSFNSELDNITILSDLNKYVKKELHKEFFKNKDIKTIMQNLFDNKRYGYRIRFRSIISKSLNEIEYKKYCDQREKLFKYKRKNFLRWIGQFTSIESIDMYIINFFIFLFLDRLYLILETYLRLNYVYSNTKTTQEYVIDNIKQFHNFDFILNKLTSSHPHNISSTNKTNNVIYESDELDKNTGMLDSLLHNFDDIYKNLTKPNINNFYLSLDLIYNTDVYYFKITNKITFEKLVKIDISSYINETNVYKIIQLDKDKNTDPWKTLTNFALLQNRKLNLPKFDCFSIFLIVRFKYYLEEFKENSNIDYIYKIVKEEYDKVEEYLKRDHFDEEDFEYKHLVPIYLDLKKELKKVNEYIKFYGNLISFVNFIQKYANPSTNMVKTEQNEEQEMFDLSFFLSSHLNDNVKKE
ncbi:conserved Plasmodium protein, unknown function [Plasmodium sp. DRC-Itaito]|nr:conserved Plasmodium protein, unknown function [Plasmodium sp. DRC-Itaito]